jgi:hypothetical protein
MSSVSCGTLTASGLSECNSRLEQAAAVLISVKGTSYTAAELLTLAKTKTGVALAAGIVSIYLPITGYTSSTDAPKVETNALGTKGVFDSSIPSGSVSLDRAFEDYQALWLNNNSIVEVEFFTKDNKRILTETGNGTYKGFRAEIYSQVDLPVFGTPNEAHPIHLFFKNVTEFLNMKVMPMTFSYSDIEDVTPIGLDLDATGVYGTPTAGAIATKAHLRGAITGLAGLTTWAVLDSNVSTAAVTATDSGLGVYSLAITKNATPEALAAGDWVKVQGHLLASTFATYITNPLVVDGV